MPKVRGFELGVGSLCTDALPPPILELELSSCTSAYPHANCINRLSGPPDPSFVPIPFE